MDGRANHVALARSWPLLRSPLLPLTDYTCRHHSPALPIQAGRGLRRAEEGLGREGRSRGGRIDRFGISRLNHDPNQDVRPRARLDDGEESWRRADRRRVGFIVVCPSFSSLPLSTLVISPNARNLCRMTHWRILWHVMRCDGWQGKQAKGRALP